MMKPEGILNPVVICLCRRWGSPAPAAIAPVPPTIDCLALHRVLTEGTPNRDNLRIVGDVLSRVIGLNIEGARRKPDRVDQPILLCQDLQKASLHGTGAS